jgi:hypothetical protein
MWAARAAPQMWARRASLLTATAVLALAVWSLWQRWRMLSASPFPLGVDGYFYPVQLRALLDHGALAYPASPLAFYLLAPFAAATDPITGAKLGAAVWGAAIAIPAYGAGARLGGGRGAGLVAAALATTAVGSAYLTAEFVKNGIGLTVALAALWAVLAAGDRPTRPRLAAALLALAAAWATHKMAAALVAAVAVPTAIAAATTHGRLRGRRLIYAITAALLAGVALLALGAAFPHRFLSTSDMALVHGLFSATPRWTAPALVFSDGELAMGHDAVLGFWIALAAAALLTMNRRTARARTAPRTARPASPATLPAPDAAPPTSTTPSSATPASAAPASAAPASAVPASAAPSPPISVAAWPILLLAVVIGLPFLSVTNRDGLGFRLRIAAFVPMSLAAAVLVRAAAAAMARRWGDRGSTAPAVFARRGARDLVLAAAAAVLAWVRQPGDRLDGEIVAHPALVSAAQALRGRVPAGATLIVPERHIAFMVAWYTGAPVAIRPQGVPAAQRYRLLPLHFIVSGSALDRELMAARAEPSLIPPLGVHPGHPNGLVLVAEPTWRWIVDRLPPADRARARAWPTI